MQVVSPQFLEQIDPPSFCTSNLGFLNGEKRLDLIGYLEMTACPICIDVSMNDPSVVWFSQNLYPRVQAMISGWQ